MFIIGNILGNRASAKERKEKREQIKSHQQPASRLEIDQKLEERNERDQNSKRIKIRGKRVSCGNTGSVLQLGITKGASEFETTQKERK